MESQLIMSKKFYQHFKMEFEGKKYITAGKSHWEICLS